MNWYNYLSLKEYLLVGIFIILYILSIYRTNRIAKKIKSSPNNFLNKFILRGFYFTLLIIALLGPSFGETKKEIKTVGKDIYVVVDMSESMMANDIQPSRLEKLKYELLNLITQLKEDRIGLILFSNEAFVQCPLTFDKSALKLFIRTLETRLMPDGGTDISKAISLALEKHSQSENNSTNNAKVILLISDGDDFGDETMNVINESVKKNIRIFTLGIGTAQGAKIPVANNYKRDKNGIPILTKLNQEYLQKIAIQTGGNYFEINDSTNETPELIKYLNSIQGQLLNTRDIDISANKYQYFLIIALVLMVLDQLITSKTINL